MEVARALQRMHAKNLAHRDLCPRNILLTSPSAPGPGSIPDSEAALWRAVGPHIGRPVLIDLGSSGASRIRVTSRMEALQVKENAETHSSQPYRAPELWEPPVADPSAPTEDTYTISEKADVWSLGCSMYACAFGLSPFESSRGEDGKLKLAECSHLRTLAEITFPVEPCTSPEFVELIKWMLVRDPELRPSVEEVLARIKTRLRRLVDEAAAPPSPAPASSSSAGGGKSGDSVVVSVR